MARVRIYWNDWGGNSVEINNPDFWRQLGIEPIIIDPEDEKSIAQGLEAVTQEIQQEVTEEKSEE